MTDTPSTSNEFLSIYEVAERWRISSKTVTAWVRDKKIPALKFGHQYRIYLKDVIEFETKAKTIPDSPTESK